MTDPLVLWPLILQGVVPLGLILIVALGPRRSLASWAGQVVSAATLLTAVALAGFWLALPWYLPWAMAGLLVLAALLGARRVEGRWPTSRRGRLALVGWSALSVLFAGVAVHAARGRRPPPGEPLTLAFPLHGGPYLVAAGGSNALLNPHLLTLDPRYRAHRGQSFGVDLVGVGAWGTRDAGLASPDPRDYAIFGEPVHAPCDGTVVRAFDGAPDMPVPVRSRDPLEGNHVILDCRGSWVVLAHFRSGSVEVVEGQALTVGSPIARVGNSGQSDEPHLHIHAQTPGSDGEPLSGSPVPIRFGERWPVRNARLSGGP